MKQFTVTQEQDDNGFEDPTPYTVEIAIENEDFPKIVFWGTSDALNDDDGPGALALAQHVCKLLNADLPSAYKLFEELRSRQSNVLDRIILDDPTM